MRKETTKRVGTLEQSSIYKKLLEYYVKLADGTFDYTKFSDIDGIEIVLLSLDILWFKIQN